MILRFTHGFLLIPILFLILSYISALKYIPNPNYIPDPKLISNYIPIPYHISKPN